MDKGSGRCQARRGRHGEPRQRERGAGGATGAESGVRLVALRTVAWRGKRKEEGRKEPGPV
jgi:hypothetical protein